MNHTLRALATIALCLPSAVVARGAERAAFLAAHCMKCHGSDAQEGGVRVDNLTAEITTVEMAERWQKVLNVLNAGEMPPEEHAYGFGWVVKDGPAGKVIAASFPIDPAGAFHNGPAFKDYFELRDQIAARGDDFLRGLIENLYAYALGRPVSFADAETIDGLVAQAKANGGGLASIIQSIVATPEFRTK